MRPIDPLVNPDGTLSNAWDPLNRVTTYSYYQGRFVPVLTYIIDNWQRTVAAIDYDFTTNRMISSTRTVRPTPTTTRTSPTGTPSRRTRQATPGSSSTRCVPSGPA